MHCTSRVRYEYMHAYRHLDSELAAAALDLRLDDGEHVVEAREAAAAVERRGRQDVRRRRDKRHMQRHRLGRERRARTQRRADRLDALISEARDLHVGADLHRVRREQPAHVLEQQLASARLEITIVEHCWVPDTHARKHTHQLLDRRMKSMNGGTYAT